MPRPSRSRRSRHGSRCSNDSSSPPTPPERFSRSGGAGGVGSLLIQLAHQLTGVEVVATASRPDSRDWALSLGATAVVNHHDLLAEIDRAGIGPLDAVFSPFTRGNIETFAAILRPFGNVVAIDEPEGLDLLPLKTKSIGFHWEFMGTRPRFQTADMGRHGEILAEVARLVDDGRIQSVARTVIPHLDADGLREAHRVVTSGSAIGKVVVVDEAFQG